MQLIPCLFFYLILNDKSFEIANLSSLVIIMVLEILLSFVFVVCVVALSAGAVIPPDDAPANDSRAPDANLQLEWVYGYRAQV